MSGQYETPAGRKSSGYMSLDYEGSGQNNRIRCFLEEVGSGVIGARTPLSYPLLLEKTSTFLTAGPEEGNLTHRDFFSSQHVHSLHVNEKAQSKVSTCRTNENNHSSLISHSHSEIRTGSRLVSFTEIAQPQTCALSATNRKELCEDTKFSQDVAAPLSSLNLPENLQVLAQEPHAGILDITATAARRFQEEPPQAKSEEPLPLEWIPPDVSSHSRSTVVTRQDLQAMNRLLDDAKGESPRTSLFRKEMEKSGMTSKLEKMRKKNEREVADQNVEVDRFNEKREVFKKRLALSEPFVRAFATKYERAKQISNADRRRISAQCDELDRLHSKLRESQMIRKRKQQLLEKAAPNKEIVEATASTIGSGFQSGEDILRRREALVKGKVELNERIASKCCTFSP
eukprot:GHVT01090219.1.p1 GENE.GHVT01090219.1~~GHVT01090219.1.p1  ORF type:complete len:400 (-),score=36.18 GHVT01090219.1:3616-4815(-)